MAAPGTPLSRILATAGDFVKPNAGACFITRSVVVSYAPTPGVLYGLTERERLASDFAGASSGLGSMYALGPAHNQ